MPPHVPDPAGRFLPAADLHGYGRNHPATADAVSAIFELVKFANINVTNECSKELVAAAGATIKKLCDVLGIITEREEELLDADIEKLIEERQAARKAKDFARADEIRDLLAAQGILLKDTREGVKWSRA